MTKDNGIKIDLSQVKIETYFEWLKDSSNHYAFFLILDAAVVGGIAKRPMSELPAIIAEFSKAASEFAERTQTAIASIQYQNWLKSKGESE